MGLCLATLTACGEPPDKEMQQAQGAIDAARAAGAEQYAREEFAAATEALQRAHEATAARDYRLALNHALDSRERAHDAAREAADNKAAARVAADRAVQTAAEALARAERRLIELEARRVPPKALSPPREALLTAQRQLQEARSAFDRGEFGRASADAADTSERLVAVHRALDTASVAPPRRGR